MCVPVGQGTALGSLGRIQVKYREMEHRQKVRYVWARTLNVWADLKQNKRRHDNSDRKVRGRSPRRMWRVMERSNVLVPPRLKLGE